MDAFKGHFGYGIAAANRLVILPSNSRIQRSLIQTHELIKAHEPQMIIRRERITVKLVQDNSYL